MIRHAKQRYLFTDFKDIIKTVKTNELPNI